MIRLPLLILLLPYTSGLSMMASSKPDRTLVPKPDVRDHSKFDVDNNASQYTADVQQSLDTFGQNSSGVTIKPASHLANGIALSSKEPRTAEKIIEILLPHDDTRSQLIQSSFQDGADASFMPTANGFVDTAIQAYNQHRHLKIRPEDVWLAILTQLSSYINAHAEELRGSFVAHEGQKRLQINYDHGTRFTVDWADFSYKVGTMIQDNVVDPELREWMMPAFSTTASHDVVVASIVMMASMQKYFEYVCCITCGLPSVTLLGNRADYELILRRLDKLRSYGKESTLFADLLTPVLKRFVRSFDEPESKEVLDFWNRIFSRYNMGSGADDYTGWITAFMFWNKDGEMLYSEERFSDVDEHLPPLTLDGMTYHTISADHVPPGFCTVPVKIVDNGVEIESEMLAGSVGFDWTSSGGEVAEPEKGRLDTVQPRSGWWIYEKLPQAEVEAKRKAEEERQWAEHERWMADFKAKQGAIEKKEDL